MIWVAPLLAMIGLAPFAPDSKLDLVPVDYVADVLLRLLSADLSNGDVLHVSAGDRYAATMRELGGIASRSSGQARAIRFCSDSEWRSDPSMRHARRAVSRYMPFLAANVTYSTAKLERTLGASYRPPPVATTYLPEMLDGFDAKQALSHSIDP